MSRHLGGHGPFGIVPVSSGIPMSVHYVHPQVSWGHLVYHMGNFGNIVHPSKGMPYMKIPMHCYMGHMGGSYYLTSHGHGIYNNPPYKNQ